jgi:NAD(P)H-quinone oxidoreductase subunit 6
MSLDIYQNIWTYLSWVIPNLFGEAQPHLHFWFLSLVVIVSAIGVVSVKNLMHAAMLLALCMVSIAGIFILLNAEVLAAIQVLVYAGGVVTLIIFAIMLSESIIGKNIVTHNRQSVTALGVAVLMAIVMTVILQFNQDGQFVGHLRWWLPPTRNDFPLVENAQLVGKSLMTTYTLAFWIASILLTVSMIGALILARSEKDMPGEGELSVPDEPDAETIKEDVE